MLNNLSFHHLPGLVLSSYSCIRSSNMAHDDRVVGFVERNAPKSSTGSKRRGRRMCTYSSKMKKRNLKLNLNNVLRHLWNFKNTTPPPTFVRSCVSLVCLRRVLISMLFCSFDIGWDSSSSIYGTFFWWTFCLSWRGVVGLRAGGITSAARQWPNSENRIINSATRHHHPHVIAVVLSLPALATLWTDEEYLPPSLQQHRVTGQGKKSWSFDLHCFCLGRSCIIYHPLL